MAGEPIFTALRKSETSPLFVPIRRQSHVIHKLACCQVGRMLSAEDCADDIRSQQRETEQSCRIRRDYTLRFGDFFNGEGLIRKHSIPDHMGADESAYQARIWSFGMGSILDNYLHLIANAPETHRNR